MTAPGAFDLSSSLSVASPFAAVTLTAFNIIPYVSLSHSSSSSLNLPRPLSVSLIRHRRSSSRRRCLRRLSFHRNETPFFSQSSTRSPPLPLTANSAAQHSGTFVEHVAGIKGSAECFRSWRIWRIQKLAVEESPAVASKKEKMKEETVSSS